REHGRVVRGQALALGQQLRGAAVEGGAQAPSRAARISARGMGAGPTPARRRSPSRWSRQLASVPVTYSAPLSTSAASFARPIRADSSGYSTENAPPKPQYSWRLGRPHRSSPPP